MGTGRTRWPASTWRRCGLEVAGVGGGGGGDGGGASETLRNGCRGSWLEPGEEDGVFIPPDL